MAKKPIQSIIYKCKYCGEDYHPKEKDRKTYCSRECAFADKAAPVKSTESPVCIVCGGIFEGRQNARYCSDDCRKSRARERAKISYKPVESTTKICKHCGLDFTAKTRGQIYCRDCNSTKRKEAKKMHKGGVSKAKRNRIYERDNYTCQLCGEPLRMDKLNTLGTPRPHPKSPTVDHIIPISVAKLANWESIDINSEDNLRAAHYSCNSARGNRV